MTNLKGCKEHKAAFVTSCLPCVEEIYEEGSKSLELLDKLYNTYIHYVPAFAEGDEVFTVKMVTSDKNGELVELWKEVKGHLRK